MSHSTQIRNTLFIHDGDPKDGQVTVRTDDGEMDVPFNDIMEFIADYVRGQRICALEVSTTAAILGI